MVVYVRPVNVPAVVTIAVPDSVVSVNPVTLGEVPVTAETLYVVPVVYPVIVAVPPLVPVILTRSLTASVDAPQVNWPAVPETATVAARVATPGVPVIVSRSPTARVELPQVNCPAVPEVATVAARVPAVVMLLNVLLVSPTIAFT